MFLLYRFQGTGSKKAAKAVEEKSVEMILARICFRLRVMFMRLFPIGMKKFFKTTVDQSAAERDTICFSAGKVGYQVEMAIGDLGKIIRIQLADITKS